MPTPRPLPFSISKYTCEAYLGGNLSEVYRGRDSLTGSAVAVKLLEPGAEHGDVFRRRFIAETQVAARVAHPNIVTTYDAGEVNGLFYLAMELLQGETLGAFLRRGGLQQQDQAIGFAWQIAHALAYLHDLGIIHRDIKPENISVEPGGLIKLFDFGVARLVDLNITKRGEQVGTPLYMSPEQVKGKPVTRSCDVYSFGVLFYLMLTGTFPYRARNREELFNAIIAQEPDLKALQSADPPPEVGTTVARCLEKNSLLRPKSFHEIAQVLRPYAPSELAGSSTLVQPARPQGKDPSWVNTPMEIPVPKIEPPKTMVAPVAGPGMFASAAAPQPAPSNTGTGSGGRSSGAANASPVGNRVQQSPVMTPHPPVPAVVPDKNVFPHQPGQAPADPARSRRMSVFAVIAAVLSGAFLFGGGWWLSRYLQSQSNTAQAGGANAKGAGLRTAIPEPEMVFVPAGSALLGRDAHPVDVAAFYIDKTEVTNRDFLQFCRQTGQTCPPGIETSPPDFPVVRVNFEEAAKFAKWTGRRLPTASEWQKAARGDKGDEFPWGNQPRFNLANIGGEPNRTLVPVSSYPAGASPYGALNMVGNVWEWVDAPEAMQDADFERLRNRVSPPLERHESVYQIRGGSYRHSIALEEMGTVIWDYAVAPSRMRREDIGFRCAKDGPR